jgi:hypothetical protein
MDKICFFSLDKSTVKHVVQKYGRLKKVGTLIKYNIAATSLISLCYSKQFSMTHAIATIGAKAVSLL